MKITDNAFRENFIDYLESSSKRYSEFNKKVKAGEISQNKNTTSNIAGFIKGLVDIDPKKDDGSFLTSKIAYLVSCFLPKTNLFDVIGSEIQKEFFMKYENDIRDCFLVSKKLKTGTDNLLCLYDDCVNEKKRFIDVSHIDETLKLEQSYIPEFYLYIMWVDQSIIDNQKIIELRKEAGRIAAEKTKDYIEKCFMKYLQ